jgi:hypothetical protein
MATGCNIEAERVERGARTITADSRSRGLLWLWLWHLHSARLCIYILYSIARARAHTQIAYAYSERYIWCMGMYLFFPSRHSAPLVRTLISVYLFYRRAGNIFFENIWGRMGRALTCE